MTNDESRLFHASLNVSDLTRSVAFYRVLFGVEAAKHLADYAKFEIDDPPLVLSLIPGAASRGSCLNHVGLRVPHSDELVAIQHRLEAGGITTKREEGVACCHAKQTKFWVPDPDGILWEIYVFHEDIDDHGSDQLQSVEDLGIETTRTSWQHRIGESLDQTIPHPENSVHEVELEGSLNAGSPDAFETLLCEAFRVLRPGGEIRLHGLTSDFPLKEEHPELPGPAVVVDHVSSHRVVAKSLVSTGFVGVRIDQLSSTAHFEVGGIGLREFRASAIKPGHRGGAATRRAIYLGPFAEVTDDAGNSYPRGEPVVVNTHDWCLIQKRGDANFLLLP